ncbi:MAG: hypothetical protein LBL47_01230 [Lactobacillus sp.]|jgi:ABC-type dipeptide/oligopeptide/nickel transport system permease subunit|nr:hypothetical protein [Lactobacillus sp.]
MIRGIIALFKSGTIMSPPILFGVLFGLYWGFSRSLDELVGIYTSVFLYIFVILAMFAFNYFFKTVYKEDNDEVDYKAIGLNTAASVLRFLLYSACAAVLASLMMM